MAYVWEYDCDSNWKVPAENTLESYHVTALHQRFFGDILPPEQNVQHLLDQRYTGLTFDATSKMEQLQARLNRWLGSEPTSKYLHRHIYPNTMLVSTDTINYALMYMPTSPTTVRIRMRFFAIRGTRRGLIASLISWLAWRFAKSKTLQVHNEDRAVYASQQKGLERSRHSGVIGSREERIYFFQKYILEALGLPIPADPAKVGLMNAPETSLATEKSP
ncbi:MAG: RHO alpha subunit C-terminal catalytic domain-containing protein [Planctomycetaceae bacterium]